MSSSSTSSTSETTTSTTSSSSDLELHLEPSKPLTEPFSILLCMDLRYEDFLCYPGLLFTTPSSQLQEHLSRRKFPPTRLVDTCSCLDVRFCTDSLIEAKAFVTSALRNRHLSGRVGLEVCTNQACVLFQAVLLPLSTLAVPRAMLFSAGICTNLALRATGCLFFLIFFLIFK